MSRKIAPSDDLHGNHEIGRERTHAPDLLLYNGVDGIFTHATRRQPSAAERRDWRFQRARPVMAPAIRTHTAHGSVLRIGQHAAMVD
jgi:hypothetical protein